MYHVSHLVQVIVIMIKCLPISLPEVGYML